MIRGLKDFRGYPVRGIDGEIGSVRDFYFDDYNWTVRYFVIKTGKWLEHERILVATVSLAKTELEANSLPVDLTREKVRNSPRVIIDRPLTRAERIELHSYYEWPMDWIEGEIPGTGPGLTGYPLVELADEIKENQAENEQSSSEGQHRHLHSFRDVPGFRLLARDGEIGHLEDFIVDTSSWNILYIVVDTGSWLPGKKVLVSPSWVEEILWDEERLQIDLNRDTIQNSPRYDPSISLDEEYTDMLAKYYSQR